MRCLLIVTVRFVILGFNKPPDVIAKSSLYRILLGHLRQITLFPYRKPVIKTEINHLIAAIIDYLAIKLAGGSTKSRCSRVNKSHVIAQVSARFL